MTKRIFMLFVGLLFLGACGGDDPSDLVPEVSAVEDGELDDLFGDATGDTATDGELIVSDVVGELTQSGAVQDCRRNLYDATWKCEKSGDDVHRVYYYVHQSPSTIDYSGTEREVQRICELSEKDGDEPYEVFKWAHNEKAYCVDELNLAIAGKRAEGYTCEQTIEHNRSDVSDEPCPRP